MSGTDYFGGCQHQGKEPCEACRKHREKFDAIIRALPKWPGRPVPASPSEHGGAAKEES